MLDTNTILSWVAAVVAVVGAILSVVKAFRTTPTERADVASKYQDIASKAATEADRANTRCDELEQTLKDQQVEIEKLTKQLIEYRKGVKVLIAQLEANGIPPGWHPKD